MTQPSSAITPHGLQSLYNEQPKTPQREQTPPPAANPPSPRGFRVRRRAKATDGSTFGCGISSKISSVMAGFQETAIPSVEVSDQETLVSLEVQPVLAGHRHVTPMHQLAQPFPQTPDEHFYRAQTPLQPELTPEPFSRPSSPFSGVSDSSDGSMIDSEDDFSYGGSVTSPESDAADPFSYESPSKSFTSSHGHQALSSPTPHRFKPKRVWTKEMDNHLWTTYMNYVNDPKVTPFKTLAGCPPPVGVCHRVASTARKTWKGGPASTVCLRLHQDGQGSPDTVVEEASTPRQYPAWPCRGSSTRRRLRVLCKRRAPITPHYKRMMRSASPYMAEPPLVSMRAGSPDTPKDSFGTRDVAMSLATSTSKTMHPNGPLAQMGADDRQDWFNRPQTSMAPVPFDMHNELRNASTVRLGSPFSGSHTWGPSRSRVHERPRAATLHPGPTDQIPRLRSPVHFSSMRGVPSQSSFSTARTPKRPATTTLEEELSASDTARRMRHEDVLENNFQNASRRLRLRGVSLGAHFAISHRHIVDAAATVAGPRTHAAPRPPIFASLPPAGMYTAGLEDPFCPTPRTEQAPRLGSPFPGISSRPTRYRGRHVPSLSLPQVPMAESGSVDQRMTNGIAE